MYLKQIKSFTTYKSYNFTLFNAYYYLLLFQIFRQDVTTCQAGDNVGVIVRGIKKDVMEKGMTLAAYRSASLHNR